MSRADDAADAAAEVWRELHATSTSDANRYAAALELARLVGDRETEGVLRWIVWHYALDHDRAPRSADEAAAWARHKAEQRPHRTARCGVLLTGRTGLCQASKQHCHHTAEPRPWRVPS